MRSAAWRQALIQSSEPGAFAIASTRMDMSSTRCEHEIINLIATGKSNSEIASELVVSLRTAEGHPRNNRRKSPAVERKDISTFALRA